MKLLLKRFLPLSLALALLLGLAGCGKKEPGTAGSTPLGERGTHPLPHPRA